MASKYILKRWDEEIGTGYEGERYNQKEFQFDNIDDLKLVIETEINGAKIGFNEHYEWLENGGGCDVFQKEPGCIVINTYDNKYFKTFTIISNDETGDDARYTAITTGTGDASGMSLSIMGQPKGEISFNDDGVNA